MKKIKEYQLILVLSFIVVVLGVIKLTYKPDWSNNLNRNLVTPTPTITAIKNNDSDIKEKYPLEPILPYYGTNFDIKDYTEPLTILVKIKSKDQEKIIQEMTTLFEKQKIDINSHKFEWEN